MICLSCVINESLKSFVGKNGTDGTCGYCKNFAKVVEDSCLFSYIYARVEENIATEDDLSSLEHIDAYEGGSDDLSITTYELVFMEWINLENEKFFDDLCDSAPARFKINSRGDKTHFVLDDGNLDRNIYEERWLVFIEGIKHIHRFFNPNARNFLDSVFKFHVSNDGKLKPEVIRTIVQGEELFRARYAESYDSAKDIVENPASQFGSTPRHLASSQRMTPSGISALYCAFDRSTCLSEIRAITGDNIVSVAITPTGTLKLLDLTRLENVEPPQLSLLDEGYLDSVHLKTFLRSLVTKMSRPKGRRDELSYLSTQVVFEYLQLRFSKQVDGLVFPSVQTGNIGTNVVLFPDASIISDTQYERSDAMEAVFNDKPLNLFKENERLAIVANSLRYHKVKSIKTEAITYRSIHELYLSDELRVRLGFNNGVLES